MSTNHRRRPQGRQPIPTGLALFLLIAAFPTLSGADDIEVYLQPPLDPVPPNVLFLLDESGSMDTSVEAGDVGETRRDALVRALHNIVNMGVMESVNAALLGYTTADRDDPPTIRLIAHTGDFSIVDENRASFNASIDQLQALNFTPTTDALATAVDWFNPQRTPDLIQGSNLISPLSGDPETGRCAPNRIVLLSDGAPNTSERTAYEGTTCEEVNLFDNFEEDNPQWYNRGARCAKEISAWAYRTDLATDQGWDGVQNILTYTLTFGAEEDSLTKQFMDGIAAEGGGESWLVVTEEDIENALFEIIEDTRQSIDYALNAPAIPFNPDNAAVNGEYIYVPMFYPETRHFWRGNLKKYSIRVSDDEIRLLASGGDRVLNDDHTFASTVDLFCDQGGCPADEGEPLNGGAASNMTGLRELYTNLDPTVSLDSTDNRVHRNNTTLTVELLDATDEEERIDLLDWISRNPEYRETEEQPAHVGVMGAPIHTQPLAVNYADGETVYLPTSEGVLEAIDADSGRELWAFMPRDLLPDIRQIRNNQPSVVPYYGLDGPMTVYETNGHIMAIFGMRRGGRKYHLLDISDRTSPEYVTEISRESSPNEFGKLGQTWSKPLFVKMRIQGNERDVLIFGGGYDPDQDNSTGADDEGNAIYIVDAGTGALLRSISNSGASLNIPGMDNAIPSSLATVDINGNGMVDRIYAADVGGKIIRVDFPDGDNAAAPSGGIVADINQESGGAHRKFFTTPQVGYYARGIYQFLVLLIGTGDHAHPLDSTVTDRFYMIKDGNIWNQVSDYETAGDRNFIPATTTALTNGEVLNPESRGWYIEFTGSEKSYSRAILYDYSIFFTTYRADRVTPDEPCQAASTTGSALIYGLDLISANAAIDWNGESEGPLTISDRTTQLALKGIPPSPMLIFPGGVDENGNPEIGKKIFLFSDLEKKHEWNDRFRAIYWEEVIED